MEFYLGVIVLVVFFVFAAIPLLGDFFLGNGVHTYAEAMKMGMACVLAVSLVGGGSVVVIWALSVVFS